MLLDAFRTERLTLVPLTAAYADAMAVALGDPALHTYTGGAPDTAEALRARYARLAAGSPDPAVSWVNLAVLLRPQDAGGARGPDGDDGRPTGYVQATVSGGRAELAWVVGTTWQGRGIAKEAALGLAEGLRALGVGEFTAHIHPDHHASAAVARAVGLSPTTTWHDGEVMWSTSVVRAGSDR